MNLISRSIVRPRLGCQIWTRHMAAVFALGLVLAPGPAMAQAEATSLQVADGEKPPRVLETAPDQTITRAGLLEPGTRILQRFAVDQIKLVDIQVAGLEGSGEIKLVDADGWLVGRGRAINATTQQLRTAVPSGTYRVQLARPLDGEAKYAVKVQSLSTAASTDSGARGVFVAAGGDRSRSTSSGNAVSTGSSGSGGGTISTAGGGVSGGGGGGGGTPGLGSSGGGGAGGGGSGGASPATGSGGSSSGSGGRGSGNPDSPETTTGENSSDGAQRGGQTTPASGETDSGGPSGGQPDSGRTQVVTNESNSGGDSTGSGSNGSSGGDSSVGVVRGGSQNGQDNAITGGSSSGSNSGSSDTDGSSQQTSGAGTTGGSGGVTTISGGSPRGSQRSSGPEGIHRLIAWENIAHTTRNETTRNVRRSMLEGGWPGFVRRFVRPSLNWGVRRYMLHNPFGDKTGWPMDADQYLEAKEAGLTWLTEDFVEAWRPVTQGKYTGGEPVEVIAYAGSFRDTREFRELKRQGKIDAWHDLAMKTLKPFLDAGMSIGLDAASDAKADDPVVTLAERLQARGHTVYIEAVPPKSATHWKDFPTIALKRFWERADRTDGAYKRPGVMLINGHSRPEDARGMQWLVDMTREALDKGHDVALPVRWIKNNTDVSAAGLLAGRD